MEDIDVEKLETFMTDLSDSVSYGQLICKSLKEKMTCTTSTLRLVTDINNKLRDKVEYLKEHNNLLIDEILEYINENKFLPSRPRKSGEGDRHSKNTADDIIMRTHKAKSHTDEVIKL